VASGFCRLLAKDGRSFTASGTYTKHISWHLNVPTKTQQLEICFGFLMVLVFVTVLGAGLANGG